MKNEKNSGTFYDSNAMDNSRQFSMRYVLKKLKLSD